MRNVVVYSLLSLDGVAESPERFVTEWDDELDANLAAVIGAQDVVILGRRSYDEWAAHWPANDTEPFASFINAVPKYVATSTPLSLGWSNTSVIDGGLVEFIQSLKGESGGDIGVHASITVAQALLAAGVVDRLRVVVAPKIVGAGRRLLDGLPALGLEVVETLTSPTGALVLDYRLLL